MVTPTTPKPKKSLDLMLCRCCSRCYHRWSESPIWPSDGRKKGTKKMWACNSLWIFVPQHSETPGSYHSLSELLLNAYHTAHEYDIQSELLQCFRATRLRFFWALPGGISINFSFISNTVANTRTFSLLLFVKLVLLQRFDHFTLTMQRKSKENWFYCRVSPKV